MCDDLLRRRQAGEAACRIPAQRDQLAALAGVTDDRGRVVGKDVRHWREIADVDRRLDCRDWRPARVLGFG